MATKIQIWETCPQCEGTGRDTRGASSAPCARCAFRGPGEPEHKGYVSRLVSLTEFDRIPRISTRPEDR